MTYKELYFAATTWTASHVAKDLEENYGRNSQVSQHDIDQVNYWQAKEGGKLIPSVPPPTAAAPKNATWKDLSKEQRQYATQLSVDEGWSRAEAIQLAYAQ